MTMMLTKEELLEQKEASLAVPGCPEIILTPKDMTSDRSWQRLLLGYSLDRRDFVSLDNWKRYFYLAIQMTAGVVIIHGPEGSGKSLELYYTGMQMRDLFGKRFTCDLPPKPGFGEFLEIDDIGFSQELNKFQEAAKIEKAVINGDKEQWELNEVLNDIKLFNTIVALDEAYEKMDKSRRTKFSLNMGHFIRKWRHYHNLFILCTPDADDIDRRMAWNRRTHEIHCFFDDRDKVCQYRIWWKKAGITKIHELVPANWSHIWESENVVPQATIVIPRRIPEEDDAVSSRV